MSPQKYLDTYNGQALLFSPSPAREKAGLRGQCVQGPCFFVTANGAPVVWDDAYQWKDKAPRQFYDWIPNSPTAVPQSGDLIIWDKSLPNTGGAGHMAVLLQAFAGTGRFISVDQNWGGKYIHAVTHNYDKVIGWLRIRKAVVANAAPAPVPAPTPAPAVKKGDLPMSPDEEREAYNIVLERPMEGNPSGRSGIQFMRGAQPELAGRRQAIATERSNMQNQINRQNQTITDFTIKLNDATLGNDEKQKALDNALAVMADTNSKLAASHDRIEDLEVARSAELSKVSAQAVAPASRTAGPVAAAVAILANVLTAWKRPKA